MTDGRNLPEARLRRLASLARVGARTGVGLLVQRDLKSVTDQAAGVLGNLRGLAAKLGQMASYVDGLVPEQHRAAFEASMSQLQRAAASSPPEAVRAVIEEELCQPLDRLFGHFEEEPFASASIGQVHRARLFDGSAVAVKVQHPGIDRALQNDLTNVGLIEGLVAVAGARKLDSRRIYEEVKARFLEELDYRIEAANQRRFSAIHAGDPQVCIPAVIDSHSSERVLTSELVTGDVLEVAATRSEQERAAYCRTLWRFVFKGNLLGGMFNADPHPGNYLFHADGRVTFLDFGCVQPILPANRALSREIHLAALDRDEQRFAAAVKRLLRTQGGAFERFVVSYTRRCFEPLFGSPFRLTRAYAADLVQGLHAAKKELLFSRDARLVPPPPGLVLMNRLQAGFYSVLARFDAEVDYAQVERDFLVGALDPPP